MDAISSTSHEDVNDLSPTDPAMLTFEPCSGRECAGQMAG
jgi:hypothetical protein